MAKVSIVMGSDSDLPIMAQAADFLEEMGIDYEMTIISAHREPDVFFEYAKSAEAKGFKVIIAGAGMAAHLAGAIAANTTIPVIGIGAGGGVDGQVLVVTDMLGMTNDFSPRFLRRYADLFTIVTEAVGHYVEDVKSGDFPNEKEQY